MGDAVDRRDETGVGATRPQPAPAPDAAIARAGDFVAADVGGTNARIALVRPGDDGRFDILDYRRYACAAFPGLADILADFVAHVGRVRHMAIASAGVVLDGEVINSNLPWRISLRALREALALRDLHVINDFAAAAHGVARLQAADSRLLTPGVEDAAAGPVLVVGPGTGLGAAVCIPHRGGEVVLPTEAGMAAFAPGDEREIEVLRWMQRQGARHVSTEQLVSGPGLVNLYRATCAIDGGRATLQAPVEISTAARAGDPASLAAVLAFCGLLGSVIGDLAVVSGARGVYVAGGIVPQLAD